LLLALRERRWGMPLTKKGFWNIGDKGLGLRSASGPTDIDGAAYAMDDGYSPMDFLTFKINESEWMGHLEATLEQVLSFEGSGGRFLLIVTGARGTGERYGGGKTFPKCNRVGGAVVVSTELQGASVNGLSGWVIDQVNAL
jgi:hypothetical protein